MKIILFDAHAILRWTQKERGYQKVKNLLIACRDQSATGYMNQINLGEVYYKTIRAVGIDRAKEFLENFFRLPVQIILPDSELIWSASEIKASYSISYADCFAAATALRLKATILTGDPEFKKLVSLVPIEWLS
ncbi:MAG: type II toxin-antitoxin system VapC family toxin [Deltaproteobacteria bacterium]|nr:type II toxin-antitoxin system VapC family toxin [Deltaproteobacteria bacterium]